VLKANYTYGHLHHIIRNKHADHMSQSLQTQFMYVN
jgi:hypothetical protein